MFKEPDWYVTPQEFADLVVETMEELNYFKADELHHPEDISITLGIVAESLAKGMGYAGNRVYQAQVTKEGLDRLAEKIKAERKEALMKPSDLKKMALPEDQELRPTGYL